MSRYFYEYTFLTLLGKSLGSGIAGLNSKCVFKEFWGRDSELGVVLMLNARSDTS